MTSPPPDSSTARQRAAGQENAHELSLRSAGVPAELPSRPEPAGGHAAEWVPADPATLRRVRAALTGYDP